MSVAVPRGFAAAGVAAGIKAGDALDVALIVAQEGATAAAVFTVNQVAAAPVRLSREHLAAGTAIRAVVLNSGGANAATGAVGDETALQMAQAVADRVSCDPSQVLVCSTGTIGSHLPRAEVLAGIEAAADALDGGPGASRLAAQAIMTTDSVPKESTYRSESGWSIGAMVKGAGMIRPDMATMLAVLTTDAIVESAALNSALRNGVDHSFHELNVDGCASTNDTVILLASAASGIAPDPDEFSNAVASVCRDLAEQMAADAEGASRVVVIHITGTDSDATARTLGRAVADSALVRSAFYGGDPNWGRIIGALGVAAANDSVSRADIDFIGVPVARDGVAVECDEDALAVQLETGNFAVDVRVGNGPGEAHVLTTDLTPDYVRFNGERS
ncbi:MAG: bifunctional glutamate N-acetyltransferase/amino-acid acetyltransferase ArgJ [bacterium]|nr:bifunctional glutamate N-acetyltransferase/amino-acid acetyltransferase ArgJ [bacterium]